MMREILFRGKTEYLGRWVQGDLYKSSKSVFIMVNNADSYAKTNHPVIPETVGQSTGLTDKNGVQIWENDIVKGLFYHERPILAVVKFKDGAFGLEWDRSGAKTFFAFTSLCNVEYEVIGNLFDNPELLEGGVVDAT